MATWSKICAVLATLWGGFIFSNSLKTGTTSSTMSGGFVGFLVDLLNKIGFTVDSEIISVFVRKSGHIIEFLVLAVLVSLVFTLSGKRIKFYLFNILFICLFTGVADEFIQTFITGRSGQVSDIVIDFCGAIIGVIIVALCTKKKYRRRY